MLDQFWLSGKDKFKNQHEEKNLAKKAKSLAKKAKNLAIKIFVVHLGNVILFELIDQFPNTRSKLFELI